MSLTLIAASKAEKTRTIFKHYNSLFQPDHRQHFFFSKNSAGLVEMGKILKAQTGFVRGDFDSIAVTVLTMQEHCLDTFQPCFVFDNMVSDSIKPIVRAITELRQSDIDVIVLTCKEAVVKALDDADFILCGQTVGRKNKKLSNSMIDIMLEHQSIRDIPIHADRRKAAKVNMSELCTSKAYMMITTETSTIESIVIVKGKSKKSKEKAVQVPEEVPIMKLPGVELSRTKNSIRSRRARSHRDRTALNEIKKNYFAPYSGAASTTTATKR